MKEETLEEYVLEEDRETVVNVVEFLKEEYIEPLRQGPIWLTGSAVIEGEEPNDYDIVVQRKAKDQRPPRRSRSAHPVHRMAEDIVNRSRNRSDPGAVDPEEDYEVVAKMLSELADYELFEDIDERELEHRPEDFIYRSQNVREDRRVGTEAEPETRLEFAIEGVDIDLTFQGDPPRRGERLTERYR